MAIQILEVLSVNVVLVGSELLKTPEEIAACGAAIDREIHTQDGAFIDVTLKGISSPGKILRLPRDRIIMEISPIRSKVTKEYPSSIDDVSYVARIFACALASAIDRDLAVTAYGFNIAMIFSSDSSNEGALSYLGQKIFTRPVFAPNQWHSIGAQGKWIFQDGDRQWTLTFEPRLQDPSTSKIFLDINLHITKREIPEEFEVELGLRELWEKSHSLVEGIETDAPLQ